MRDSSSSACALHKPSPPWVARILSGDPVAMGEGFECNEQQEEEEASASASCNEVANRTQGDHSGKCSTNNMSSGSGERWMLFKMNVELPGSEEPKVLTVHHGDVPVEVSSQFCRENGLGDEFVPVLAESINAQMNASLQSGNKSL